MIKTEKAAFCRELCKTSRAVLEGFTDTKQTEKLAAYLYFSSAAIHVICDRNLGMYLSAEYVVYLQNGVEVRIQTGEQRITGYLNGEEIVVLDLYIAVADLLDDIAQSAWTICGKERAKLLHQEATTEIYDILA